MTVGRILLGTFVTLVVLLVLWSWQLMRPGPPIKISKQTTYITEPLADDGLPDYVAYLDAKYGEGVTPENNATVPLVRASGLRETGGETRDEWFMRLGMEYLPIDGDYLVPLSDPLTIEESANWLIAYWRSQQDGNDPPKSMAGLREYSQRMARLETGDQEPDWRYGGSFDDVAMTDIADRDWLPLAQQAGDTLNTRAQERPWTSAQIPPLAAWVDTNADLLDMVVAASQRPRMYAPLLTGESAAMPQLYSVLLPTMQDVRMLCRGLQARTMRSLGEGRFADAQRDISAAHRLARLSAQGPFLIQYLVAIAVDGMACQQQIALAAQRDVPADVLVASLAELRGLERWQQAPELIDQAERLGALDATLMLRRSPLGLGEWGVQEGPVLSRLAQSNIDWNIVLGQMNGYYDDVVAAMRTPDREEREQAFTAVDTRLQGFGDELPSRLAGAALSRSSRSELIADVLAAMLIPAAQGVTVAEDRANANLDLATTALALALYRTRHGEYPDTLGALVPEVLDEVPTDLFADGPFRYEQRGEGYLLYSVGQNRVDDGGTDVSRQVVKGEWLIDAEAQSVRSDQSDLVVRVPLPPLVIPPLPEDVTLPQLADEEVPEAEDTEETP